MHINQLKYNLKVIRRGYKKLSNNFHLANTCLLIMACLFTFLLLIYEPSKDWHTTSFVLQSIEYRPGGRYGSGVLDIYTTDGRRFVLGKNGKALQNQLQEGATYNAVYSDDLFRDAIKALSDAEAELLSLAETKAEFRSERVFLLIASVGAFILFISINVRCSISCMRKEERRLQEFQKSKKK